MTGRLTALGSRPCPCLLVVALGLLHGSTGCGHDGVDSASAVGAIEPTNRPIPDVLDGKGRPAFRSGSPRPWEGGAVSGAAAWSVHPGGSVQNRVRIAAWPSAAVGDPITVSLVHDAASAGESRAAGKGFRLAVGALLTRTAAGVDLQEPDGTHRHFLPNAAGGFDPEVFDTDRLVTEGSTFVVHGFGGARRVFTAGRGELFRETQRIDRVGDVVTIVYDSDNYPIAIRDSVGRAALFGRSPGGRYQTLSDPEGRVHRLVYTGDDLTEIQAPAVAGAVPRLRLRYDAGHRIVSRSGWGDQNATAFTYDDAGRVTRVLLPERYEHFDFAWSDTSFRLSDAFGRSARYVYANGALVESTDARGLVTTLSRDDRRRPISIVDPRGRTTRLVYDDRNDLVAVTDSSGRTTRTHHDDRHRPETVEDPLGGVTTYRYDAFDGVTSVTTPRGETTRWERDRFGNVVRVVDFANRVRMTAAYDARGHLVARTGATGRSETFTYNAFGGVATIQGVDGRITRQTSTATGAPTEIVNGLGEIARFRYDPLGRLATASNPSGSLAFGYDLDNRVVSLTDGTAATSKRLEVAYTPDGRIARRSLDGIDLQAVAEQISGVP
jgi:YD repeat-containing protein